MKDEQKHETLDQLLGYYQPAGASTDIKMRVRLLARTPQASGLFLIFTRRRAALAAAFCAALIVAGAWTGCGPLGLVAHSQEWIDAAITDAVFGPTNLGDIL